MTDFEKIEKLREHADITFEEAKQALEAAGGDLLDAAIWLERHGKIKGPSETVHSTKYEDQKAYVSVSGKVEQNDNAKPLTGRKIVKVLKRVLDFLIENFFVISKNEKEIVIVPLLVLVIALIFLLPFTVITLAVLLFFGFHYSFRGKHDLNGANEAMNKAADAASGFADRVKEDFK